MGLAHKAKASRLAFGTEFVKLCLGTFIVLCCRPPFNEIHEWLEALHLHLEAGGPVPSPLVSDFVPRFPKSPEVDGSTSLPLYSDEMNTDEVYDKRLSL